MPVKEYKTEKEWRRTFKEKAELMTERGYEEVPPFAFYRDMFPVGSFQAKGEKGTGKGNMVATKIEKEGKKRSRQYVITDDLEDLEKVMGVQFGLIAPLSWYGKSHKRSNAHELYAIVIDIDYVGKQQLKNLLKQFGNGVQLAPTYLVSSGRGVHCYYFLKEPVQLYHNVEDTLSELKKALIRRLWNDTSSMKADEPDITGIFQGFRCVGCQSKLGADYIVKAYKISGQRYTLEEIRDSIPNCKVDIESIYRKPEWKEDTKKHIPMEQAKELYPEWYEETIVKGIKKPKSEKNWTCNTALYEWWKNKIRSEVKVGGRYYSLMALCMYGKKCGLSDGQIRKDAWEFYDYLESLTDDETNHFTRKDVQEALECLKDDFVQKKKITREWVEEHTKVRIPPNKRNGLKQKQHLYLARRRKEDMKAIDLPMKAPEGRPSKKDHVKEYLEQHPTATKSEIKEATGLTYPTIRKYYDEIKAELEVKVEL